VQFIHEGIDCSEQFPEIGGSILKVVQDAPVSMPTVLHIFEAEVSGCFPVGEPVNRMARDDIL
jgi:hypothetical protein